MSEDLTSKFKGFTIRPIRREAIPKYSDLLSESFHNFRPSIAYLNWLYFENPRGMVLGYDAYDGETLVAHYACIPIKISGFQQNSLLSLNTATHPDYQGRGLFGILASKTFESAARNFANVIGVANAKSVGGFVKHLGFSAIGSLELRIGKLSRKAEGARVFTEEEIKWRIDCPGRPLSMFSIRSGHFLISAKPFKISPSLKAIMFREGVSVRDSHPLRIGITLDWRRDSNPLLKLPKRLKPSPLVLIFKPLLESDSEVLTSFSFPDFDAF